MSAVNVLKKVRKLLRNPKRWIKGHNAIDKDGCNVDPCSPSATCFCLSGAIEYESRHYSRDISTAAYELLQRAIRSRYVGLAKIVNFNDYEKRTHGDVLRKLDQAIAIGEKKGSCEA